MENGVICKYRHLLSDHPEAILDKQRNREKMALKNKEKINLLPDSQPVKILSPSVSVEVEEIK